MKHLLVILLLFFCNLSAKSNDMIIRISEIEIDSAYTQEYYEILQEEARASVLLEPGVIAIYPMFQKENPTQIRILEIYANQNAYKEHLKTPHFIKYKTETHKMVKSLKLIDMENIDPKTMTDIFSKMKLQGKEKPEKKARFRAR